MSKNNCKSAVSALAIIMAFAQGLSAQEESGNISYDEGHFAPYQPVTLRDMLQYVPGGVTILNSLSRHGDNRGMGSTGAQILIDGRRMSGKSNDVTGQLTRIQASQVERIELIRDTADGLDIRNEGVMINVVLKQDSTSKGSTYVELTGLYNRRHGVEPEFLVSHTGSKGKLDYTVSYNLDRWQRASREQESRFSPTGTPEEFRDMERSSLMRKHLFTSNLKYDFGDGHMARFNALYEDEDYHSPRLEDQFIAGTDTLIGQEEFFFDSPDYKWEIGGDYEGDLGFAGHLKALFVANYTSDIDDISQYFIADGERATTFLMESDGIAEEKIFRASLTKTLFDSHTFEYGGEGAFNSLESTQSFDGEPGETGLVKEDRYEAFLTHSMNFGKTTLQSAINREFSKIRQDSFGASNSRSFQYWKPRVEARHDFDNRNQLRFLVERNVSQLNLERFFAERNSEDDTIDFGNPDLVPEKTWKYAVSFEHRLNGDAGTIEAEIYREQITDHIDKIEVEPGVIGAGNIGDASRNGLDVTTTFKLDFAGIPNATLTTAYKYKDTETTDPFLGMTRVLQSEPKHYITTDFRHDITDLGLTWGMSIHKRSAQYRTDYSLFEHRTNAWHFSDIYVEYKLPAGMKLTGEISQAFRDKKYYTKTIYEDGIEDGTVSRIEERFTTVQPSFSLKLQATF